MVNALMHARCLDFRLAPATPQYVTLLLFLRALAWWLVTAGIAAAEGAGWEGPRWSPLPVPAAPGWTQLREAVQPGRREAVSDLYGWTVGTDGGTQARAFGSSLR